MCGIAGVMEFRSPALQPVVVARMTARLVHRGPDDCGHVVFDPSGRPRTWVGDEAPDVPSVCGLGTRRLKIIDLSEGGHQPMFNQSRTLCLVYNGEIYNYIELKAELRHAGRHFSGQSDSEVILHAYEEWGPACFGRFNGMWALAIFDVRDGSLVLSRDRWGVKPLYVHRSTSRLVFGSEVKALLEHPSVPRQPNYSTIYNYVARHYRWVDGGRDTFFEGIENLPPAHYWKVSRSGDIRESRYWSLDPARRAAPRSDADVVEEFRELFFDSVRVRLRADVPVACMLSGGLDSSSVTCVAARLSDRPVTTFSARYEEADFDEGPYIVDTIQHTDADGRFIWPKSGDLIDTLETMLRFHDEPVCTVTWFAHWMVMREVAGSGFPVLLNGHVGDELFAGYWGHYPYYFVDLQREDPALFRIEYDRWMANHTRDPQEYPRFRAQLAAIDSGEIGKADPLTHYDRAVNADVRANYSRLPLRPNPFRSRGRLDEKLYDEISYETVPATLRPEDRNSMAFSIETRSPFLDFRLAEFAFSLPSRYKIRDGLGKWVIREGMKGILPEKVRARRDKQGFNAPTVHWYRSGSRDAVRDILGSASLARHGILDQREILRAFDEHAGGTANHYMAIWQWLNLELWMRQMFDERPASVLTGRAVS
jgi:asparagine synthase (glutamine-hydrolysing)